MKVYRFEHKQTKKVMFTSEFAMDHEYFHLNLEIKNYLLSAYRRDKSLLPDPQDEFYTRYIDTLCDEDYNSRFVLLDRFTDYISDGAIFACEELEQISKWCLKDKSILNKMIKCGYFLYEYEIDESQNIYELSSQVVFRREHILKKKVLHVKTVLKEFFK